MATAEELPVDTRATVLEMAQSSFEAEKIEEVCTLFSPVDPDTGARSTSLARRTLKPCDARLRPQRRLGAL